MQVDVIESGGVGRDRRAEIVKLCSAAYGEDLAPYFADIGPGCHVLGIETGRLVSHAMWVTRWLLPDGGARLETAYVEVVATAPTHRGKGLATRLMRRLQREVADYDLAALSTAGTSMYDRLGWEDWRGRLFVRTRAGLRPTPDDEIKILRLANTPSDLDLGASLSVEWRAGEVW